MPPTRQSMPAVPPGFRTLIAAQALSALADNALLIVAIALLEERSLPGWWAPLLKFAFTLAYVLLAPWLGPLADAMPKARLMRAMTLVKAMGVGLLVAGVNPVAAFALVGIAAAAYAPAKYGLVTELVPRERLVAANGWIEVSVVCAALFGALLGGLLAAGFVRTSAASVWVQAALAGGPTAPGTLGFSLAVLLGVYALSGGLAFGVPDSGARYPACRSLGPLALARDFARANATLWRDRDGGLSLAVTTVFWGVGATLQFAVLRWAGDVLALPLERAAALQAAVAIGVIAGAWCAGRIVPLAQARRALPAGVLLGLLIACVAGTGSLAVALPLLVLVGAVGGLMVVPLNALLQHRGHALLSAGRSIAVQGFNENLSILVMLAGYAALLRGGVPIVPTMVLFGLGVAATIAALMWGERRRGRVEDHQDSPTAGAVVGLRQGREA